MQSRGFTLIITQQSMAPIIQIRCPSLLIQTLLVIGTVTFVSVPGCAYYLVQHYHEMRQQAAALPQMRQHTLRQQALLELYEEHVGEIRANIAQLQRMHAQLLVLAGIEQPLFGPPFGMASNGAFTPLSSLDSDDDKAADLLTLTEDVQRQQRIAHRLEEFFDNQAHRLISTPAIWPVPGFTDLTSPFGMRKNPVTGQHTMHWGIDIGAAEGAPIVATADGVVAFSGEKSTFGNVIVLDHGSEYTTFYGHCSGLEKQAGERVKRGDMIARVGSTGRSTINHLHYEVRIDGVARNPIEFIVGM